jgi:sarcosine oxidase
MPGLANHFDVIVIGVGAMGSATCYELARRGRRVLGLEQFHIAHDRGSSHGYTRLIRLAYFEHADYVPLLRRAYENWRAIEGESGEQVLFVTGGLYAGPRGCDLVMRSADAANTHGIDYQLLDRGAIAKRFPQFNLPDDFAAVYEPAAGFLRPELAIGTYAAHARRLGAAIRENQPVRSWSTTKSHIAVVTDAHTYTADRIVFTGGMWTSKLVRDLGIPLVVTRQLLGWVRPPDPLQFARNRFPCWAVELADGSFYYGVPRNEFEPGMKIADHGVGPVVEDADQTSREVTPVDADAVNRMITTVLPIAAGPIAEMRVCHYTNSPDAHFIIGPDPRDPRITLACGFSGHGFKFASVVGEVLADLAIDGRTRMPIAFLSPMRFAKQSEQTR